MTHDSQHEPLRRAADLSAHYADLLGSSAEDDAALVRLVGDLDAYYTADVPVGLAPALDAAIRLRGERDAEEEDDALVATGRSRPRFGPIEHRSTGIEGAFVMRTRRISTIIGSIAAVLVVGLLAAVLVSAHAGSGTSGTTQAGSQQFAQQGGTRLLLQVTTCPADASGKPAANCNANAVLASFIKAMQQRIAAVPGIHGAVVTGVGSDQVQIDIPGAPDPTVDAMTDAILFGGNDTFDVVDTHGVQLIKFDEIENRLCPTGYPCPSNAYLVAFTGSQLDKSLISAGRDPISGAPIVTFAFAGAARDQFATYTAQNIGKPLTLTMSGIVIESSIIHTKITGNAQITGAQSLTQAQQWATIMKLGPLPYTVNLLAVTIFGPHYSCVSPTPGPVGTTPPTPGPTGTVAPTPGPTGTVAPTPKPSSSGQAANFAPVYNAPVYNGGPGSPCLPDPTPGPSGTPVPPTPGPATITPLP